MLETTFGKRKPVGDKMCVKLSGTQYIFEDIPLHPILQDLETVVLVFLTQP